VTVTVTDVPGAKRYEARVDGALAGFSTYIRTSDIIAVIHTEVDPAFEGKGVGSALARTALDDARASGREVLAACPFVAGWMAKHPDYQDLEYRPRSSVSD
jgi:predicted GNAT family acetyltransferase